MKRPNNTAYDLNKISAIWSARKRQRKKLIADPDKEEKRIEEDLEHLFGDLEDCLQREVVKVYARNNHIYFQSAVTQKSVEKLIELLEKQNDDYEQLCLNKRIKKVEPEPIYLHITSPGGDLLMGFLAVDSIKNSKIPVYTIVEGYAASCGSLMAVVGKKRFMTKHSSHLIHQLSSTMWGTFKFAEMEDEYHSSKMFMKSIVDIYVEHTKMTKKTIEDQLKHDSWWNSEKCLEVEIVDEITK